MKNHKEFWLIYMPYIERNSISIFPIMMVIEKKKQTVVTQYGHNFISWKYIYILIFS